MSVLAYHQRGGRLSLSQLWRKAIGSAVTLGSGNAFGFEGPSMLIGGRIGSTVEQRFGSRLRGDDAKVLMVASFKYSQRGTVRSHPPWRACNARLRGGTVRIDEPARCTHSGGGRARQ
jgi:hypothetical protein